MDNLQHELTSGQKQLEDAEGNTKMLTNDLVTYKSRIEVADNSIESLSSKLNAAQSESDILNEDMTAKLDAMTKQKEHLSDSMNTLMRELAMVSDDRSPSTKIRAARAVSSSEKGDEAQATRSMQMNVDENLSLIGKLKLDLRSLQSQKADLLKTTKEKNAAIDDLVSKKEEMAQRMEILSTEIEHANEKKSSLSTELDDTKKAASQQHERFNIQIFSLEADLLESRQEEERLDSVVKSLECSHAAALACLEDGNNAAIDDLVSKKREMTQRIEILSTDIEHANEKSSSLSTELDDAN